MSKEESKPDFEKYFPSGMVNADRAIKAFNDVWTTHVEPLQSENEKLREALKPFEALAKVVCKDMKYNRILYAYDMVEITTGDLKKVLELLTPTVRDKQK